MRNKTLHFLLSILLSAFAVSAQTDVTNQHLQNPGFDINFNYGVATTGNISGDIINNVHGWTRDMNATYTVAGSFAYGSGATFNASNPVPNAGYLGSTGGALALSTGWGTVLNYSQAVTLKSGKYTIATAYYNAGTATAGTSIVGWVPGGSISPDLSTTTTFPIGTWVADTIVFYVLVETQGKIQVGFTSRSGVGSGSSAKLLIDYVHLYYHGTDKTELNTIIAEAEVLYGDGTGTDADILLALINRARAITADENADMEQIVNIKNALVEGIAMFKLSNASELHPIDMTSHIQNPGFETSLTGWINDGMGIQTNTVFPFKEGLNYAERWVSRGSRVPTTSIEQLLKNIPNGKYTLTAAAGNIQQITAGGTVNGTPAPQTGAYLFAGNKTVAVDTIKDRSISFVVFNKQVLIGFKAVNATGNWVTLDNFRLKYEGNRLPVFASYLDELRTETQTLLSETMLNADRSRLVSAIEQAQQAVAAVPLVFESLQSAHAGLLLSGDAAGVSIKACSNLQTAINTAAAAYADGSGFEAENLNNKIVAAQQLLVSLDGTVEELNTAAAGLDIAVFAYRLANATGVVPTVVTNTNFARGATAAFGRSNITGVTMANVLEHGFCWSTHPEPTVMDNRATKILSNNGNIYHIQNLQPATVYYMRAYAITRSYAVGYGNIIKVITIPRGTMTYQLNASVTSAEGHHERIAAAMKSAVDYWNNLTSIQGKHLSINHHPGTPTAEASYSGYMQFGANSSYQRTGTALHEMGHNIGVGTHSIWHGPNSPLRAEGTRGRWLGERTTKLMQFIDNNPNATLTGDAVHMWPYGINGAHEDSGSELLYIANSLITQALGEDGLPPTGGFATPAYTFPSEGGVKYYLKSENASTGRNTSYLMIDQTGRIANRVMNSTDALLNDSVAWYLDFNVANSYYRIRNVATGKYFSYVQSGINGIGLMQRTTPGAAENFQLMGARITTQVGTGSAAFTTKGYWIVRPEQKLNPLCFSALQSTSTSTTTFSIDNSSSTQRWLILTGSDVTSFGQAVISSTETLSDAISSIRMYTVSGKLVIDLIPFGSDVEIYDISGRIVHKADKVSYSCTFELHNGLYIVSIRNKNEVISRKVRM